MLQFVYNVVDFVGQISTKLLILLRSFTLYTYKGIAKIIVACYMVDSLRPICFGFFKLYIATILQGFDSSSYLSCFTQPLSRMIS